MVWLVCEIHSWHQKAFEFFCCLTCDVIQVIIPSCALQRNLFRSMIHLLLKTQVCNFCGGLGLGIQLSWSKLLQPFTLFDDGGGSNCPIYDDYVFKVDSLLWFNTYYVPRSNLYLKRSLLYSVDKQIEQCSNSRDHLKYWWCK